MKIILDAMGGDNAPEAPVLGAVEAAKTYGIEIVLVGRGEDILAVLKKHGIDNLPEGMEISNADDVVDMHDDPASVIHKRKNSSMVIGLKMLADGLWRRVRLRRFHRRAAHRRDAAGQAGQGNPPCRHGARHAQQGRGKDRDRGLRRQRRVYAGISAAIRPGRLCLREEAAGYRESQRSVF